MMYLGYLFILIAVAAVIFGFMQRKKMKTIVSAPFKPTGQVQGSAGPDGLISCQGAIAVTQPLAAPVSGEPCFYYEIEIKQEWEQHVQTEDGMKKKTGKDTAHTAKAGSMFNVDDGSGPVQVDATDKVDAKLEKSHTEKKSYGYGDITFGSYQVHINRPSDSDKHAIATHLTEKILPADGNVFVVGKLTGDTITKRDGMLGNIMLAREGRDALMGSSKRNMMIGFIVAGLTFVSGVPMAAFGTAPAAAADTCSGMTDGLTSPCIGRSYDANDVVFNWTVTTEADYAFSSVGTGQSTTMRIWPDITVRNASGPMFHMSASDGAPVESQSHFMPGSYEIHVNDTHYGWAENLEGGAGFSLMITQVPGSAVAAGAEPTGDQPAADDAPADDAPAPDDGNK